MRIVILFFCICFSIGSQAQSNDWFAPVGATWTYYSFTGSPPGGYHQRPYFQTKVVKDSIILGMECRKLQVFEADGTLRDNSTVWLYVDSNQVHFLQQDTFFLFFKKDLKVGDTLNYPMPHNYWLYDFTCCTADKLVHRVGSIDTITIGGQQLKRWNFDRWYPRKNYFVEKIGMVPFFGAGGVCCLGGFPGDFHCYQDQTTFINVDSMDCTYPLSVDPTESTQLQISPNPTSGTIVLSIPQMIDLSSARLQLFAINGQLVYQQSVQAHAVTISTEVPAGHYLLKLIAINHLITEQVVVIR